jgi:hypothetical protein
MPMKTHRIPRDGKAKPVASPKGSVVPFVLSGGALLVIIVGIVLLTIRARVSSGDGSPAQVAGRPALAVDQQQINFGKVPLDKAVKATFRLHNAGDQPLQILNQPVVEVKQGC